MQPIQFQLPRPGLIHSQLNDCSRKPCQTRTIGVIIPEVEHQFFVLAIDGIEAVARQNDYYVVICLTYGEESRQVASMQLLADGRVDGVLLHNSADALGEAPSKVSLKGNIPLVLFDSGADHFYGTSTTTGKERSHSLALPPVIDQPAYAIGKEAAEMLFQAMREGA